MLSMQSFEPSPELSPVIERFFFTTGNVPEEQTWEHEALPSIMQSFILSFTGSRPYIITAQATQDVSGDLIIGQHTRRFKSAMTGQLEFLGVHFTPTGLYQLLQQPMSRFADTICRMEDHLPWYGMLQQQLKSATTIAERIKVMETLIIDNKAKAVYTLEAVATAATLICNSNGSIPLARVEREAGLSERSLQRYFPEYVGISPKTFARIARFNGVTRLMESEPSLNWQHILLEAGYFDASHFAHDFKSITGQTPTAYYKGKTEYEAFFYGT
jgi:AraC-like DNA-binding protein